MSPSTPLTLPPNWQAVEPTTEGIQAAADAVRDSNPDLAAFLDQGAAAGTADQFELIAIGQDDTGYMGIVNVARSPGLGTTLDALESLATGSGGVALPTGLTGLESRRIQLPIGEALMVTASTGTWFVIGYYVVVGDQVIRVDTVCDPRSLERCQRDSDEMIRTLTISDP